MVYSVTKNSVIKALNFHRYLSYESLYKVGRSCSYHSFSAIDFFLLSSAWKN